MGAKNINTERAAVQRRLDELRDLITTWYIDQKFTAFNIMDMLRTYDLFLTPGQVHYAIHRFGLKRPRQTMTKIHLAALRSRKYPTKTCQHCNEEYVPCSGNQVYCEICSPRKPLGTWSRRIKTYGISKREFDAMFESQHGTCAICPEQLPALDTVIDHDHVTLRVRGLLCRNCNLKLSVIEDVQFTTNAQAYLVQHKPSL